MGSCNTEKKETSGKQWLLKVCRTVEAASVAIGTADDPTHIIKAAHELAVGDLIRFPTVPGSVSEITANVIYYVKTVPSTGTFTISATLGGAAITFTDTIADIDFEAFSTAAGLRTSGLSLASEGVETSNHGTNEWKEFADEAGMRSGSISGEGVISNSDNFDIMEGDFLNNLLTCLAFINVKNGKIYYGCFKITALELTGEYAGEATYSMSAESSGPITRVLAA